MKQRIIIAMVVLVSVSLIFTGVFAQGSGRGGGQQQGGQQQSGQQTGGSQPSSGNQPQNSGQGGQTQNQGESQFIQNGSGDPINVNTDTILSAINSVEDADTKAALMALFEAYQIAAAGDSFAEERDVLQALHNAMAAAGLQLMNEPLNYSYAYGRAYGRFLDVGNVAEAIASVTDAELATDLAALLAAYEDALDNDDPQAVKEALEALLQGLTDAQLQVDEYTGLQLNKAFLGTMLDVAAVEAAIIALENQETVMDLLALLDSYIMTSTGGNIPAAQEAFTALMDALAAAGIQG